MKRVITMAVAAAAVAVGMPVLADGWKTVRKEADFKKLVVGKNITWGENDAVINADGTLGGTLKNSGAYNGNWIWSGRFYCRNFVIEGKAQGTNCAKVEVDGNKLRLTNDKGRAEPREYNLN